MVSINPACFEDALADGKEFCILPAMNGGNTPWTMRELRHTLQKDRKLAEQLQNELSLHQLRSYLQEEELKKPCITCTVYPVSLSRRMEPIPCIWPWGL